MSTPKYIKDAQNRYNQKFDLIQLKLPKGTKERIKNITSLSYNEHIKSLVLSDLERLETNSAQEQEKTLYNACTKSETVKTEEGQPDILQNEFPAEENVCPF